VSGAVGGAVGDAEIRQSVANAIQGLRYNYLGGQFWVGGWYWGGAYTSFFREVCDLDLAGDLWGRGLAYEATMESACWWFPHRDFIMVCERPTAIHRELARSDRARGWGSHRLHCADGPAVTWADGWGLYAIHGVQVPFKQRHIIDHPEQITLEEINTEANAEIRRIMVERYGYERYLRESDAKLIDSAPTDHPLAGLRTAKLWGIGDIVMLDVLNSTPEPDGTTKRYVIPVDGSLYDGRAGRELLAATASTWRKRGDKTQLAFARPEDYAPAFES
jgi:hypothetical protein